MPYLQYNPAQHLAQMGVKVDYIDGLDVCGQYIHEERRVEIRAGLDPVIERSVLAHEAAHAELGHQPQVAWCHELKQERVANSMAGRRLINFRKFMELQGDGRSEKDICAELGVARIVLRAYTWLMAPAWDA